MILDEHEVTAVENGTQAIEVFDPDKFDLVIVDRAMPDMSGDEVAKAIKAQRSTIPIIMLTGFGNLMKGDDDYPEGVDTVLSKPFTQQGIQIAIATVMDNAS